MEEERKVEDIPFEMAKEALGHYNLQEMEVTLIRHNENLTFCVDNQYLLRIHKSVDGFRTMMEYGEGTQKELRETEMKFLLHLKRKGIDVQKPVRNCDGELVTELTDGTLCSVLTWLPGRQLSSEDIDPEMCFHIGETIALLHQVARSFPKSKALYYDKALCERAKQLFDEMVERKKLSEVFADIMKGALSVIGEALEGAKSEVLYVHSDLSLSNILISHMHLVPIDFSLGGYCNPMNDIAGIFCNINGIENRLAVAEGYRAKGEEIDYHMLDCCFALGIILGILLHAESWTSKDWFEEKMKRWCLETFTPLCNGEPLFSKGFRKNHAG